MVPARAGSLPAKIVAGTELCLDGADGVGPHNGITLVVMVVTGNRVPSAGTADCHQGLRLQ